MFDVTNYFIIIYSLNFLATNKILQPRFGFKINGITVGYAIRLEVSKSELKDNFLGFFVHLFIVYQLTLDPFPTFCLTVKPLY